MGLLGTQSWTLCVFLCWMCVNLASAEPHYMVAIPAVLEAGAETRFCASLRQPSETLVMTVTLRSQDMNTTLLEKTSSEEFHECILFPVPLVKNIDVQTLEVFVRGATFHSKEVRKIMIKVYKPGMFVQTDKPIYLPGQTVHFRVVTLDSKFRPVSQLYDIITLEDHYNNRIGQWLNESSNSKILQLSYDLSSEARTGIYRIIVSVGEDKLYQDFKVEKYVLPKFEVTLNVKKELSMGQEEFDVEVCAKYTYGQPVPSTVTVEVCRPPPRHYYGALNSPPEMEVVEFRGLCDTKTNKANNTGCATFGFRMSNFTRIDQKILMDKLEVSATADEDGTGISLLQRTNIRLTYRIGKLSFIDTPTFYERGSDLKGKVKAVNYNDMPIPDMPLFLFVGEIWSARRLQNITTDSNGVATFSLSTNEFSENVVLHVGNTPTLVYPGYRTAFYEGSRQSLSESVPPSPDTTTVSSLEVKKKDEPLSCGKEEDISIRYTLVKEEQGTVYVTYLVLSRGAIITQGQKQFQIQDNQSVNKGEVSFKFEVSPDMAPDVQIVAYAILPSMNVIAHSADVPTEKCFRNKVLLEFSRSSAVPGEQTKMQLTAQPDSLCGLSAIDQSVLIKEPGKTLNEEKIFHVLPVRKVSHVPHEVQDPINCLHVRPKRYVLPHPYPGEDTNDAHRVFENVGLKMATNLVLQLPKCLRFKGKQYHRGLHVGYVVQFSGSATPVGLGMPSSPQADYVTDAEPVKTVRSFFPESWIWDLVQVGESGKKNVSLTVPDTITTWETETFCLSSQGFGLAPRTKLTVFQPFFLELTLPYSIIRGENFELKATVFNYLTSCIMVKVTAAPSSDYTLTPLSGDQYTSCLCGSERKTLSWTMIPTALGAVNVTVTAEAVPSHASCDNEIVSVPERGRIDVVTRSLRVKAEGTEITKTHNWLLCPKGNTLKEETEMQLPDNVIGGSARATVSVLGDILGRALKNLDGLLQMPYGCGEQNMALLAPNIYILHYLQNTQQLTPAIKEKAFNFLTSGYQRQLNYKDDQGGYSTFGYGPGNTWLTAFVLRSFYKAQSFVYIDPTKIEQSKSWLEQKQNRSGCFEQSGKLFNNRMKGGVSDEITLSAYITSAFLEMNISTDDAVVNKSLMCLKESISDLSNTYTSALLAYVFTLAGDTETRAHLLRHLDTVAIKEGGFIHWSQTATEKSDSLSVEISSYVLMAKLSGPFSPEDLGYTSSIVRWLTGQQNHYGGFSSTQDTVVALQALALYSTVVFSPEGSSTVTVLSPSGQRTFDVNPVNKLLYQEEMLQDVTGKFSLEVKGAACASVQISQHYNIPTPSDVTTLSVKGEPESNCTSKSQRPKLTLKLQSLYSGKESSTNMVILDIKSLSGFVPDPDSLTQLKSAQLVDRVEQKEDHVLVYLQELRNGTAINHSLELVQELPVKNLKPAVVKIYDYYQPSDQAEIEYIYPCAAGSSL
ncbi:pregnancy zone protein-like isoform X2 [Melanotaenia boesemani]|uniref:pregnancy zone protein-like isoform X2 n=1 Tax=Melanotaenia boesemani TaxID=1250792 RepID=UPI001C03C229|nr:pregnancy zone protein-like isoform X2 [Melanotaenia boesemani]